ncbi:MAG: hypothetical protein GEV06_29235, partial [Luteitalea sp.]|nr:hypothetical protein [Luteitalea sp.]
RPRRPGEGGAGLPRHPVQPGAARRAAGRLRGRLARRVQRRPRRRQEMNSWNTCSNKSGCR